MTHIVGYVSAVPDADKDAYIENARKAWKLFKEYGALEMVENWCSTRKMNLTGDPDLQEDETVCFSWILWPDAETCSECECTMDVDRRWTEIDFFLSYRCNLFGWFDTIFRGKASDEAED